MAMHYKFQQSSPIYSGTYLRFRSSTECWLLQLLHRDRAHSANCTDAQRFDSAVFGMVVDMPVGVQTTGFWSNSAENCGSAVAYSSEKVVDVPAVAVHRQGVDVPVIMQRRSLAVGSASDSAHRRSQRTSQPQQRRVLWER